jgi:hypothetical protein
VRNERICACNTGSDVKRIIIMQKRKPFVEMHKKAAEKNLADRLEMLKSKDVSDQLIHKDVKVRQFKAAIRKARLELAGIEQMARLTEKKKEAKAQKAAAAPPIAPKKKKSAPDPAKQEKKAKKAPAAEA